MSGLKIDLWHWPLSDANPEYLNPEELDRAAKFVFQRDRDHYIAARGRLRRILAQYLDEKPARVSFSYGPNGKPQVAGLEFNLSHTAGMAVLAVGQNAPLGVDIEANRPIEMAVAEAHFAPSEIAALQQLPEADQQDAFYYCWTRKEAYLKARGTGLSTDLNSFSVTLTANNPRLLSCDSGEAAEWTVMNIAAPDGITGAVAVRTNGQKVTLVERELS